MESNLKTKTLFLESHLTLSNRTIILNKVELLKRIQDIAKEKSIAKVRESVFDLENQLKDFERDGKTLLNITTNGDTITLSQRYLFNELNQIIEAQTLERCRYYLSRLTKAINQTKTNKINDININRWKEYPKIIAESLSVLLHTDDSGG